MENPGEYTVFERALLEKLERVCIALEVFNTNNSNALRKLDKLAKGAMKAPKVTPPSMVLPPLRKVGSRGRAKK